MHSSRISPSTGSRSPSNHLSSTRSFRRIVADGARCPAARRALRCSGATPTRARSSRSSATMCRRIWHSTSSRVSTCCWISRRVWVACAAARSVRLPARSARVAVTPLEPPRALGPVIDPGAIVSLDIPVVDTPWSHAGGQMPVVEPPVSAPATPAPAVAPVAAAPTDEIDQMDEIVTRSTRWTR